MRHGPAGHFYCQKAFHGLTYAALSVNGDENFREGFTPFLPDCRQTPFNDLESLERELGRRDVAAFVVEPIQGKGVNIPAPGYLREAARLCRRHGAIFIADEVQSGMGRTGKLWASEHFGLVPDILTSAKGIASGLPLGAMIARAELMDWPAGAHASTFGGNPVSVAAALATLDLLEGGLVENAARVGAHLMSRMRDWPRRFPQVGEVRGLGLMIGVEIVDRLGARESAHDLRDQLVQMAFERGLLALGAGESTLRLSPPLVIGIQQADFACRVLEECLRRQDRTLCRTAA